MSYKPLKVAIAVNKDMAKSIFYEEDIAFLSSFAEINPLADLPDEMSLEFMAQILQNADACITCWGTPAFSEDLLENAQKLRLISHAAGSVRHLVPQNYWDFGRRRITSNAPIIAEDVAQTTLALILCSLKGIWGFAKSTRSGEWSGGEASLFATRRLENLQVGLIGGSHVGKEVVKILKPFGCSLKMYDPYVSLIEAAELGVTMMELNDLISTSDVISLHVPGIEECRHIINAENAPLMKDGALFINTARGINVDEDALIKELKTGRIFACIDVTNPEPPTKDHPFRVLENVVLTPHIAGGHTINGRKSLGKNAIKKVYNYLIKGLLEHEIRPEMMDYIA